MTQITTNAGNTSAPKKPYNKPVLTNPGDLVALTHGFAGSIPDEQGGHTKRNPFQG